VLGETEMSPRSKYKSGEARRGGEGNRTRSSSSEVARELVEISRQLPTKLRKDSLKCMPTGGMPSSTISRSAYTQKANQSRGRSETQRNTASGADGREAEGEGEYIATYD